MVATTMPSNLTNSIIEAIRAMLPDGHQITPGTAFYWSPQTKTIHVRLDKLSSQHGQLALLHEASHALLGHTSYRTDVGLLKLEVAGWEKAKELAHELNIKVDENHIEDCLDTYRNWLYARSSCPSCHISGLQTASNQYECANCLRVWQVSASRFCRVYRMENRHKKTPPRLTETVFS